MCYEDNRFYEEITDVCCHVFGVDEFRPFQLPAMTAALEGFDIILNSTTGSGKSLGYQVRTWMSTTRLPSKRGHVGASAYPALPPQLCYIGFPPTAGLGRERGCRWSPSQAEMDWVFRSFPSKPLLTLWQLDSTQSSRRGAAQPSTPGFPRNIFLMLSSSRWCSV